MLTRGLALLCTETLRGRGEKVRTTLGGPRARRCRSVNQLVVRAHRLMRATAPLRLADSDEDDDIPKPEPLPQEWLADSQENMSITYNTDREGKTMFFFIVISFYYLFILFIYNHYCYYYILADGVVVQPNHTSPRCPEASPGRLRPRRVRRLPI